MLNIQEFCTLNGGPASQNSCARTSAVVLRSKGSSSHLKCKLGSLVIVSAGINYYIYFLHKCLCYSHFSVYGFLFLHSVTRVVNEWGPQTLGVDPGSVSSNLTKDTIKQGMFMSHLLKDMQVMR